MYYIDNVHSRPGLDDPLLYAAVVAAQRDGYSLHYAVSKMAVSATDVSRITIVDATGGALWRFASGPDHSPVRTGRLPFPLVRVHRLPRQTPITNPQAARNKNIGRIPETLA